MFAMVRKAAKMKENASPKRKMLRFFLADSVRLGRAMTTVVVVGGDGRVSDMCVCVKLV